PDLSTLSAPGRWARPRHGERSPSPVHTHPPGPRPSAGANTVATMDASPAADPISALREDDVDQTDRALAILSTVFGYDSFRGDQRAIIDRVAGGGDAV